MEEVMQVINRLLDIINEKDRKIDILKTELNTADDRNSQLKDENNRLIRKAREAEGRAND